jgi:bifunctional enzyme CysN/CysC
VPSKSQRAQKKNQLPVCFWLTGLPGAGKSTIARALELRLHDLGRHTYLLDGDQLRTGLNRDLGFSRADRDENVRRAAEVARLMLDAGLIVICAFISPYRSQRRLARSLLGPGEFIEVFLDTASSVCETRDPKGHYAKARRGEMPGFTGIDGSYEAPESPELRLDTAAVSVQDCVAQIIAWLETGANSAPANDTNRSP